MDRIKPRASLFMKNTKCSTDGSGGWVYFFLSGHLFIFLLLNTMNLTALTCMHIYTAVEYCASLFASSDYALFFSLASNGGQQDRHGSNAARHCRCSNSICHLE